MAGLTTFLRWQRERVSIAWSAFPLLTMTLTITSCSPKFRSCAETRSCPPPPKTSLEGGMDAGAPLEELEGGSESPTREASQTSNDSETGTPDAERDGAADSSTDDAMVPTDNQMPDAAMPDAAGTSHCQDDALLTKLEVFGGQLDPPFEPCQLEYTVNVGVLTQAVALSATAANAGATIRIADAPIGSGTTSDPLRVDLGATLHEVDVVAPSGILTTYAIRVVRGNSYEFDAYAKASNTGIDDSFANVALYGDTMVVGAPHEDSGGRGVNASPGQDTAPESGAVYVFTRNTEGWSQEAFIKAPNSDSGDMFGASVALAGDLLVVGAPREAGTGYGVNGGDQNDNTALNCGAVYLFSRSAGAWTLNAYIKPPTPGGGLAFGELVAISEDTVIVGASSNGIIPIGPKSNATEERPGVYVFWRWRDAWRYQSTLYPEGIIGRFAAAIDGDSIAVAREDEGTVDTFARAGSSWTLQSSISLAAHAVALSNNTIALGTPTDGPGAVHVYVWSESDWMPQARLEASVADLGDEFGSSVALLDDLLLIGAPGEDGRGRGTQNDNTAENSGAAYLFVRSGTTWTRQAYLKTPHPDAFDSFGSTVSLSANTMAIGAPEESSSATGIGGDQVNNDATGSGAVYVYH